MYRDADNLTRARDVVVSRIMDLRRRAGGCRVDRERFAVTVCIERQGRVAAGENRLERMTSRSDRGLRCAVFNVRRRRRPACDIVDVRAIAWGSVAKFR